MSVIRIEKTENYVSIHKGVLQDPHLSFKAKGLWAYCMGMPNDWKFKVSHLSKVSQDGEDSVYSAIKELEEQGYCKKVQQNIKGKFQSVDYVIYESRQELKKTLPQPVFPRAAFPDAGNPALLNNKKRLINKLTKAPSSPTGPSAEASALAAEFYSKLKEVHGDKIKEPNLESWSQDMDRMLRIDKLIPDKIREIMTWAILDPFWSANILSPKKLREKFSQLSIKKDNQWKTKPSHQKQELIPVSKNVTRNLATPAMLEQLFPES